MIIPKKYGGLGFTAHGHSQVVTKIASKSFSAAVTVMVPNSLGPGELLMRYGTDEQKNYYLPKLAKGEIIPCFGLTGILLYMHCLFTISFHLHYLSYVYLYFNLSYHMLYIYVYKGPVSGSDAASMVDTGIVESRDGVVGIRATFNKRYITLAPIAGI